MNFFVDRYKSVPLSISSDIEVQKWMVAVVSYDANWRAFSRMHKVLPTLQDPKKTTNRRFRLNMISAWELVQNMIEERLTWPILSFFPDRPFSQTIFLNT